jgi:hypothetical protein
MNASGGAPTRISQLCGRDVSVELQNEPDMTNMNGEERAG